MNTKRIIFKDLQNNPICQGEFLTTEAANEWLYKQLDKPTLIGRKKERWVKEGEEEGFNLQNALDTREVQNPLEGDYTEYLLPAQYTYEIIDLTQDVDFQRKQDMLVKINQGKKIRKLADDILLLITGWNDSRELSVEDINTLQSTFGTIEAYLRAGRPFSAKPLIEAITPSVLVPQELKDQVGVLYTESGLL